MDYRQTEAEKIGKNDDNIDSNVITLWPVFVGNL